MSEEVCCALVSTAEKRGATECEACIEDTTEKIITIERGSIHGKREKRNITFGLRTLLGKKKGFSAGTLPASADRAAETSLALAKNSPPDENWKHLPFPKGSTTVTGIYHKKLKEIRVEELAEGAQTMLETADHPEITIDTGRVSCFVKTFYIANSHGVSHQYTSTWFTVHFVVRCGKSESTWGVHCSRQYDCDFAALAEDTVERAHIMKTPQKLDSSFTGDVIFLGEPVEDIFLAAVKPCINAGTISKTRYATKIDEKAASDLITIHDDGTVCNGIASSPVDGEGTPTQKTALITKGVLSGVLHNEYTAHMYNTVSTGNAVRKAVREPRVGTTNLILERGKYSTDELIQNVKKGVIMGDFSGDVDPFSGLFNGVMEHSFYIEKGEIKHPITGVMIHGNAFDCLMNVEAVAKEQYTGETGIYAVPVLVKDLDIMI